MNSIQAHEVRPGMIVRFDSGRVMGVVAKSFDSGVYYLTGVDGEEVRLHGKRSVVPATMAELKAYRREVAAKAAAVNAQRAAVVREGMALLAECEI